MQKQCEVGNVYKHYKTNVKYIIKSIHRYGSKEKINKSIVCYYALEEDYAEIFYRFVEDFNEIISYDLNDGGKPVYRYQYLYNDESNNLKFEFSLKDSKKIYIQSHYLGDFIEDNKGNIQHRKIKNHQPRRM